MITKTEAITIIDWDSILETYGPEAKVSLVKLLAEAGLDENDPAAIVIAAMFIANIDSNRSFQSITETIQQGKATLSKQFEEQILQLRGVVSYAEEHLVKTHKEEVEKLDSDILDVIKLGVAKAIGREGEKRHKRATFLNSTTMVCISVLTLLSLTVGAAGAFFLTTGTRQEMPVTSEDLEALDNGQLWLQIINSNQEELETCLENSEKLERRCMITMP